MPHAHNRLVKESSPSSSIILLFSLCSILGMEWTRGPTVGRGASGTVSIATAASGELLAIKTAELRQSACLRKEQHLLSQLSSPHIVKYKGFDISCENNNLMFNLFMEYASRGTLLDAIERQGGSLDESLIRLYTDQIVRGLDYLHSKGLAHCDIKGRNILMGEDGLKIADLGCARLVGNGDFADSNFSGTPVFMAPEVARGEEQGFPADVWALGCTLIEMATGSNPWPEMDDPVSALYRIGFSGDVPEFPRWFSDDAKDFLDKCLKRNPKERLTARQLLQHPFLLNKEKSFEQGNKFARNSPTSALDQAFWDSLELPESPRSLTHVCSSFESPAERIGRLNDETSSPGSSLPDWSGDQDWITVRSNKIGESLKHCDQNCSLNPDDGSELINPDDGSELINPEGLDLDFDHFGQQEDALLDCPIGNIIGSIDRLSVGLDFGMTSCGSVKDIIVCINNTQFREEVNENNLFHSSRIPL